MGQRKILSSHEESNLRPSDLRSDALPLSHKDSSVSGVYNEVLLFCQKHYAIDIADPSSMQDACHMNFVIDLAHRGVSVAQW